MGAHIHTYFYCCFQRCFGIEGMTLYLRERESKKGKRGPTEERRPAKGCVAFWPEIDAPEVELLYSIVEAIRQHGPSPASIYLYGRPFLHYLFSFSLLFSLISFFLFSLVLSSPFPLPFPFCITLTRIKNIFDTFLLQELSPIFRIKLDFHV